MIDVKIIAKKKASGSTVSGTSKGGMVYSGSSSQTDRAAKADYATKAGTADEATHAAAADEATHAASADTASTADEATHAASAGALDADSPTREDFLSATHDDEAAGEIAFEKGVKFGSHDSDKGIDADGNATLGDIKGANATLETTTTEEIKNAAATVADRALVGGKGFDMYVDASGKSHLWIDELDVRMKAYFAQLEIRKVSYSGGTTIFSNAGSTIVKVANIENASGVTVAYKCYSKADDGTTATQNWWKVGMQALCKTFNIQAGKYADVANRYYWRLVVGVGQEVLEDGLTYDYVVLSNLSAFGARNNSNIPLFAESALAAGDTALAWGGSGVLSVTAQEWSTYYQIVKDTYGEDEAKNLPTTIYGYDTTGTDAPQPYDVIVQVGDQLHPAQYGNLVKIATSAEDSDPSGTNAPSFEMYHAMSGFAWETLTTRLAPSGNYLNAAYTKFFSGSDWSKAKSVTVYMGEWSDTEHYYAGQQVTYGGQMYTYMGATASTAGVTPAADGSGWELSVAKGEQGTDAVSIIVDPGSIVKPQGVWRITITTYVYKGTTRLVNSRGNDQYTIENISLSASGYSATTTTVSSGGDRRLILSISKDAATEGYLNFDVVVDGVSYPQRIPIAIALKGEAGEKGADGTSVTIKGTLASTDELPTSGQTAGDGYLIDGYLWVYTGSTDAGAVNGFVNVGQIKGEKGDPGTDGETAYVHIAYASDDSGTGFSANYDATKHTYIGIYTDYTEAASETWSDYQWRKFVGKDGVPGADGWTLRFNPTTLTLADSDLSELSGGSYAVNGGSGVTAAIELLHGAEAVTPTNVTLKSATNCAALVSTSGVTVTSVGHVDIVVGEEVVTMPCGSASVAVEVTADGLGTRTLTLDISCAYTKNIGQMVISDTQFKSQIAALESRADGVESNISAINQTAEEIKTSVAKVQTNVDNTKTELQSEIKQTAEAISANITDGLTETGIDITNKKIILKSDTTVLLNNAGEQIAVFNADGSLAAGSLKTTDQGEGHVEISGGLLSIFFPGISTPNIKFGIKDGYMVLSYYNHAGQLLYDLGPDGLKSNDIEEATVTQTSCRKLTSGTDYKVRFLVWDYSTGAYHWSDTFPTGLTSTQKYKAFYVAQGDLATALNRNKNYNTVGTGVTLMTYNCARLSGTPIADSNTTRGLTTAALASSADGKVFSALPFASDGALTNLASGMFISSSPGRAEGLMDVTEMEGEDEWYVVVPQYSISETDYANGKRSLALYEGRIVSESVKRYHYSNVAVSSASTASVDDEEE